MGVDVLVSQLAENLKAIEDSTGKSSDVVIRSILGVRTSFALVYIEGLVDTDIFNNNILQPLTSAANQVNDQFLEGFETFFRHHVNVASMAVTDRFEAVLSEMFNGNVIVLADGWANAAVVGAPKWKQRNVNEPTSQTVVRGPKEGFVEDIGTNVALIRKRIKSPNLWRIDRTIGTITGTKVCVMYINGIAKDSVVRELLTRLDRIQVDSILESGYIEEFIQDASYTPFPTILNVERPDAAAAALLEGQVVVLVDGTPFQLVLPVSFFKFFLSSEDYYQRFDIATFVRGIRFVAFVIAMVLPSLYISVTTYHPELLPTTMLVTLAAQREGVPLPAVLEALLMEITFEVLREAGIRMPRTIGPAISIVGALVLGQAAVEAGLVSAAMVIVVGFTAINGFVMPAYNIAVAARLIRFFLMIMAGCLGLYGVTAALLFLLIHMCGLRSFGVPYLMPISPRIPQNLKDVIVRAPWWRMHTRPKLIASPSNEVRQRKHLRPGARRK
ncbi:spore germination protein [Cohnella algarum]|uniref:spore germination protein n=1 Tax=Cohnella algarum TaxID=2044859 RepID=UPI001967EE98|nr:spore germination protein [Cohnella algarum]MBN2982310.1 spore germination protein [Cohnella algarum]